MMRVVILIAFLLLHAGCSDSAPTDTAITGSVPAPANPPTDTQSPSGTAYGVTISSVVDSAIIDRFFNTSFDWTASPADLDKLTPQQRSQAFIGGGLTVGSYDNSNVRIIEAYYTSGNLKLRAQEKRTGAGWVGHGPEIYYQENGDFELLFRVDGEVDGPVVNYNSTGAETSREIWAAGVPQR